MLLLSIDIGSTWTKGASFRFGCDGALELVDKAVYPTTVHDLSDGFFQVVNRLNPDAVPSRLFYSSSAKGGLSVAALGLVPDLTTAMANIAAQSAGARLSRVYSYSLTGEDLDALQADPPDILLFAGGTDGGNVDYVRSNAAALAEINLDCSIVFAGNREGRGIVQDFLNDHDLTVVDNLLPVLDQPNPEPARQAIRDVFLRKIVHGKGLSRIVTATGAEPVPTPYAIYEYCARIKEFVPGWKDFMLVDLGGATTDVYSQHQPQTVAGKVHRGLPEPRLKRTVEGDLGMRVSAAAAAVTGREDINRAMGSDEAAQQDFAEYIANVSKRTDSLPREHGDERFDAVLAVACITNACTRHAGRGQQVATADGLVEVQTGRDLTGVRKVIGSGGYLAHHPDFDPVTCLSDVVADSQGRRVLTPVAAEYYCDDNYLFPLLANLAREYPQAAARAGVRQLQTSRKAAA